ncbi:uncharacterized protein LOC126377524 isoform X2 [Pectinophora gossypiella]|uniref:uncharacterized protein LOC126377524 isoform X2 n=1 Tax=Pectinophora gossypiella TaxID=13191 RepID=UPI00214E4B4F|nr:uncharacterized protein LOC126377524 isoform X2 [Pectinophora gossypiella]
MDEYPKYTEEELQRLSYRSLQRLAKSMALPSNVKKVYLVQLVYAKTNKTEAEVESIVHRVRWERQQVAHTSKKRANKKQMHLQAMEVSSTNNTCLSPPLDLTPKRSASQTSPELPNLRRTLIKVQSRQPQPFNRSPNNRSDRILRSYNMKTYRRPNYSLISNSMIGLVRADDEPKEAQISIVSREGRYPRLNVAARCVVKKFRPSLLSSMAMKKDSLLAPQVAECSLVVPAKRKRTLSGIYPICGPEHPLKTNYEFIQSIGFRRTDGKISKINAVVQKPSTSYNVDTFETPGTEASYRNVEVTIQDIINSNIDAQTFTNPNVSEYMITDSSVHNYPNMAGLSDVMPCQKTSFTEEESVNSYSVYYHKKIRAEQVRTKRTVPVVPRNLANEHCLPKINDVFSKFSDRDLMQPLYVQVSEESERLPKFPTSYPRGLDVLEGLYNLRAQFMSEQPALQVLSTTSSTFLVYSTPTITTPQVQHSVTPAGDACQTSSFEQPSQSAMFAGTSDEVSRVSDLMRFAEQEMTLRRYHEALCTSNSSLDTLRSQDMSTSATIPEMVEDALEIISQDGDYLERIGMDVRMQCILCSWAGPKIILEYHIRQEHSGQIVKQDKNEWNVTYKLGSLVNQDMWLSHVSERDGALHILSVKYNDPDCFMASISTLSSESERRIGTITLYNKVTGEPFTWQGEIPQLPSNMPYENGPDCLKIELSKLELLPNSANIKLHNRSLVLNSPSKVVVGQPELNDIHIIIFIKMQNA